MDKSFNEIWVYLATSPLLWLTATLLAYQGAYWVFKRSGEHPLANPVLLAVLILAGILSVTGVSYQRYFEGAQFVHFLLGPATVALAVPLYAQFQRVSERALPVTVALLAGSLSAIVSAMAIAYWLGGSLETILSLAPKSVTTPIAMGIAERVGGLPSLTAVLVVLTGIFGAMIATTLFRIIGIKDHAVQGLAMGLASHGLGTARAFQISEQAGAFSALAMGLNGLLTALLIPLLMPLVHRLMG
jgi:predicted murein hydrolase (TIGR00659 family)